jgi:hypothetical protein
MSAVDNKSFALQQRCDALNAISKNLFGRILAEDVRTNDPTGAAIKLQKPFHATVDHRCVRRS